MVSLPCGVSIRRTVVPSPPSDSRPGCSARALARLNGELFQLTWREHVCLVYDEGTFTQRRELAYDGEGWGLTSDDELLVMSDGSAVLRFLEPTNPLGGHGLPVLETLTAVVFDAPNAPAAEHAQGEQDEFQGA